MDTKIVRYANIFDKILSVLRIILFVGLCITAITVLIGIGFYVFGQQDLLFELMEFSYVYGPIQFNIPMSGASGVSFAFFASVSILSMMTLGLLCINSLKTIVGSVKQKKPFSEIVCKHISRIAILSLVAFSIGTISEIIMYTYSYQALESTLSQIDVIKSVNLFPKMRFVSLLTSAFLFFLARIFRYGASLQKEVDETL